MFICTSRLCYGRHHSGSDTYNSLKKKGTLTAEKSEMRYKTVFKRID